MIMLGPVWDVIATVTNVIELVITGSKLAISVWLALGGIIYVIRLVSFAIDIMLINFIGKIYDYFRMILDGKLFNDAVIDAVMKNVYIFIGVILLFRLMLVLIKYIINPELISDGKAGANQLVKRVIIGVAGITLIPSIFNFINDFQVAILSDGVIQRIIIPDDIMQTVKKKEQNAGKYIGTYVFAGFINPSTKASAATKQSYKIALKKGDLTSINPVEGGLMNVAGYEYNYFFFLSTFILGYVLFLMLKYCLDLVGRMFRMFLYQLLAPIAMIEYMINGADDGVFKTWKTAVISTYCMMFVRVFAIWFVVFVMTLMSGDLPKDTYVTGTLLNEDDMLLRAIIIVALLAFMMDLPKLIGSIFGLDLEQEGSATGLLNSIKGGAGKILGAGLAAGGAIAGGIASGAKGGLGSLNQAAVNRASKKPFNATKLGQSKFGQSKFGQLLGNKVYGKNGLSANAAGSFGTLGTTGKGALTGVGKGIAGAAAGISQYSQSAYQGYNQVMDAGNSKNDKAKAKKEQEIHDMKEESFRDDVRENMKESKLDKVARLVEETSSATATVDEKTTTAAEMIVNGKMSKIDMPELEAKIQGILDQSKLKPETKQKAIVETITQEANKAGMTVEKKEIEQMVNTSYSSTSTGSQITASVIPQMETKEIENTKVEIRPHIAQTDGHRVMTTVETQHRDIFDEVHNVSNNVSTMATNTENINRNVNTVATNTENINRNVSTIATNTENINRNVSTVATNTENINRNVSTVATNTENINRNVNTMATHTERIDQNVDRVVNTTQKIDRHVRDVRDTVEDRSDALSQNMNRHSRLIRDSIDDRRSLDEGDN